jgi:hypothetical protein
MSSFVDSQATSSATPTTNTPPFAAWPHQGMFLLLPLIGSAARTSCDAHLRDRCEQAMANPTGEAERLTQAGALEMQTGSACSS